MSGDGGVHLLVNVGGAGYHRGGWHEPELELTSFIDIDHYQRIAEVAERGLIDGILLPDIPFQSPIIGSGPAQSLEPTLLCTALALTTSRIGFIPTVSTSFNRPYNLARRILSLDHVSGGRAAWNLVTTAIPAAAANFGADGVLAREDRYRRAVEFVELSNRLWDGWEEDALIGDQESGEFADPSKIHAVSHRGQFFQVLGPMNVPRSPQGRPVTVQAGASEPGVRFAATHAEVIYGSQLSLPGAIEFARRIREIATEHGRDPDQILFLPALVPVVAATEPEARARWQELESRLAPVASEAARIEATLWIAPGSLDGDVDSPLDPEIFARGPMPHEGFIHAAARFAADTGYSAREFARHVSGGHRLVVGSTTQVADHIEEWWRAGAVDGFTIAPPALPHDLAQFVELVIPELQRRGIYRREYPGTTLRANLGLPVPANSFDALTTAT
ncbi:MAG: NtaA/DmoA family FMN-dependent monooxygenase [Solirubrobacteraceae bacterium]